MIKHTQTGRRLGCGLVLNGLIFVCLLTLIFAFIGRSSPRLLKETIFLLKIGSFYQK